ncbi:MAG: CHY zinc finger protein [Candidatus Binatia bacterium]
MRFVHGEKVIGTGIDAQTRCTHYHTDLDIIAIKFKCCGEWFPCFECHAAIADHAPRVWPKSEFDEKAILCGGCGRQLTIHQYLTCDSSCPGCQSRFNPSCANHYHLYFEQ